MKRKSLSALGLLLVVTLFAAGACGGVVSTGSPIQQTSADLASSELVSTTTTTDGHLLLKCSALLDYPSLTPGKVYRSGDAVVIGEITDVLPIVQNPPSDTASPILYRGIKLAVQRWFGSGKPARSITVYHQGSGTFARSDGQLIDYVVDASAEFAVGQTIVMPIRSTCYYGVPLAANEYWAVADGRGAYVVDGQDAHRAVSLEAMAPPSAQLKDHDTLPELLKAIVSAGKVEHPLD